MPVAAEISTCIFLAVSSALIVNDLTVQGPLRPLRVLSYWAICYLYGLLLLGSLTSFGYVGDAHLFAWRINPYLLMVLGLLPLISCAINLWRRTISTARILSLLLLALACLSSGMLALVHQPTASGLTFVAGLASIIALELVQRYAV